MENKTRSFIKRNYIPILFALVALCIEFTAVYVTSGSVFIRHPWVYLTVLGALTAVQYLLGSGRAQHIFSSIALSVLFVGDLVFIVLYEMTGTIFDFSMLNLRRDAMAILESVPINFAYTSVAGILLSAFIVFGRSFGPAGPLVVSRGVKRVMACFLAALFFCHGSIIRADLIDSASEEEELVHELFSEAADGYADSGVIGNFLTEMYEGAFDEVEVGSRTEIGDFIYSETTDSDTPYFGAAEGYNVVTILAESFEWFSFLRDESLYPNGHAADEAVLRELYPNLYEFYDSSVVMLNHHARDKTDISENLSLIGSYPLDYYLNYDYPENNIPYSLPGVLKTLCGVDSYSFHNGTEEYYNRNIYLKQAVGFADFISGDDMVGMGMTDHFENGERSLDSEMMEICKERMFPTDRRFNTYITTITMHGQYSHRDNLQKYYDILDGYGVLPLQEGADTDPAAANANAFRHYAAAAMDFDRAIGIMMDYLEETGLIEKTLIVIFSDHNTYYQSLSNYVKDIYPQTGSCEITELYRLPMMIKLGTQTERTVPVEKFTCTYDIVPTILSLLGVRTYSNLYYGNSVFSGEESVFYSRAYDVYMTDRLYFKTLDSITYSSPGNDDEYLAGVQERAVALMEEISHVNRIFAADFFRGSELARFEESLRELNA